MKEHTLFALTGQIACGKGTIAKYLEEAHGASVHRFSSILRDLLDRLYIEHTRDTITTMSVNVRRAFGEDILSRVLARDMAADTNPLIVLDGVRRKEELPALETLPGFVLVAVDADERVRYERIIERSENADDRSKTFEQFLADQQKAADVTVPEVMALATERIDNNLGYIETKKQVDALVQKYAGHH